MDRLLGWHQCWPLDETSRGLLCALLKFPPVWPQGWGRSAPLLLNQKAEWASEESPLPQRATQLSSKPLPSLLTAQSATERPPVPSQPPPLYGAWQHSWSALGTRDRAARPGPCSPCLGGHCHGPSPLLCRGGGTPTPSTVKPPSHLLESRLRWKSGGSAATTAVLCWGSTARPCLCLLLEKRPGDGHFPRAAAGPRRVSLPQYTVPGGQSPCPATKSAQLPSP